MINKSEASIYNLRGNYEKALKLYSDNVKISSELMDEESTLSYSTAINCLLDLAQYWTEFSNDESIEWVVALCDTVIAICKPYESEGQLFTRYLCQAYILKGHYLINFEKYQEEGWIAIENYIDCINKLDPNKMNPDIIDSYILYAEVLGFAKGDIKKAEELYNTAIQLSELFCGHNHPQTARVYESLGRFYANAVNDIDLAISCFNEGIEIYKNLLCETNPLVAEMYLHLAGCYSIKGDEIISKTYSDKYDEIQKALGLH